MTDSGYLSKQVLYLEIINYFFHEKDYEINWKIDIE